MALLERYRALVSAKSLKPDAEQLAAAQKLDALARALKTGTGWSLFGKRQTPRGLYIWGDVGRGKSMLMDLFFEIARVPSQNAGAFQRLHG